MRDTLPAALVCLLLAAGCGGTADSAPAPAAAPPAPKMDAVKVRRGDISRSVVLPAELAAWREVTLYSKIAGYLKSWKAFPGGRTLDIGDEIADVTGEAGVLAVLSAPESEAEVGRLKAEFDKADADIKKAQADRAAAAAAAEEPLKERLSGDALIQKAASAVKAAEADVVKVQADLNLAQTTFERYKGLVADKTVTALEYDQVRTKYEAAAADRKAAESRLAALRDEEAYAKARLGEIDARVASAKSRLAAADAATAAAQAAKTVAGARLKQAEAMDDYRFIRAPFPGRVIRRYVDPGALIQAAGSTTQASPLLTLSDQSVLRVVVDVPESEVRHLGPDTAGVLTIPEMPGDGRPLKISRSADSVRPGTRTQRIEMDLPNPDRRLRAGLYGLVKLVLETHPGAVLVPAAAVGGKGAERFVFLLVDGKAAKRPVDIGFQDAGLIEIRPAALDPGGKPAKGLLEGETVLLLTAATSIVNGQPVEAAVKTY